MVQQIVITTNVQPGVKLNTGSVEVLKINKLHPDAQLPHRATDGASGFDLFAYISRINWA
jgi:dUTPase